LATATATNERIDLLDALRGFALFGILLANILYWSGWGLMTDGQRLELGGLANVTWQYRFHHLLIDGKFYTIFSLLFGAGFALQLARLTARGAEGLRIYRRRVLILLGIGLIHSWLIWDGDILTLYALLGLMLPWFHAWRERSLLIASALLIFIVPAAGIWLFAALDWHPERALYALTFAWSEALGGSADPAQSIAWLRREDLAGWLAWALSGTPFSWGLRIETWRIPKVLGIMLLGMAAGRRLAAGELVGDRRLLTAVLVAGLLVGLPCSLFYALRPGQGQADWPSLVGTVPLALAYAAGFVLLWDRARPILAHFAPVGRMALTNYLSHSILGIVIFYGIGFGLVGRLQPLGFYAVALAIFAAQMLLSRWWLSRHAQGPAEAVWRRLTYGRGGGES
jgi:uncharacterized protein